MQKQGTNYGNVYVLLKLSTTYVQLLCSVQTFVHKREVFYNILSQRFNY